MAVPLWKLLTLVKSTYNSNLDSRYFPDNNYTFLGSLSRMMFPIALEQIFRITGTRLPSGMQVDEWVDQLYMLASPAVLNTTEYPLTSLDYCFGFRRREVRTSHIHKLIIFVRDTLVLIASLLFNFYVLSLGIF
jgi:hypothetical protein